MTKTFYSAFVATALLVLVIFNNTANAKVTPAACFTDNMVLQQKTNAAIWGTEAPGKAFTIITSWNNKTYKVTPAANGDWKIKVATPSYGGPYSITFNDGETTTLNNILIGEVWVCSGQSNMEMPLTGWYGDVLNLQQELGHHAVFQIGYVGSNGHKLFRFRDINQPSQTQIDQADLNCGCINDPLSFPLRVFHNGLGYEYLQESSGNSNYNSLQTSLKINNRTSSKIRAPPTKTSRPNSWIIFFPRLRCIPTRCLLRYLSPRPFRTKSKRRPATFEPTARTAWMTRTGMSA